MSEVHLRKAKREVCFPQGLVWLFVSQYPNQKLEVYVTSTNLKFIKISQVMIVLLTTDALWHQRNKQKANKQTYCTPSGLFKSFKWRSWRKYSTILTVLFWAAKCRTFISSWKTINNSMRTSLLFPFFPTYTYLELVKICHQQTSFLAFWSAPALTNFRIMSRFPVQAARWITVRPCFEWKIKAEITTNRPHVKFTLNLFFINLVYEWALLCRILENHLPLSGIHFT